MPRWLKRGMDAGEIKAADAKGAILLDLLVYDAIGMVVTLYVLATGVLNALGWGIVVVYAFFAAASGYLLAKEKPFRRAPAQRDVQ